MAVNEKNRETRSGASRGVKKVGLSGYFTLHLQVAVQSLGRLVRAPWSALMTSAVIGIALSLPAGLYSVLDNVHQASGNWDKSAQISLFLKPHVDDGRALALAARLRNRQDVAEVDYISKEKAMEEFQSFSGFGDVLEVLQENPLPAVLVVYPEAVIGTPQRMEQLAGDFNKLPEVDNALLDMQWLKRLFALIEIAQRAILIIGGLLAIAVLLIVGNTIRLAIENRREEIVVTKLIGATNAFIRRPFLYMGFWYGVLGAIIALILINSAIIMLDVPIAQLTQLYGSSFGLTLLNFKASGAIFMTSVVLGQLGAWLAVGRHIREIEPD